MVKAKNHGGDPWPQFPFPAVLKTQSKMNRGGGGKKRNKKGGES